MQVGHRWCVTAGVVLVGAGVIAVSPITVPGPDAYVSDIALTADDATDIVIDIVRHGQRADPFNQGITPSPAYPGAPLSELGHEQAEATANQLYDELGPVSGIFSGPGLRDTETMTPFAQLEGVNPDNVPILYGLQEIDSGIYAHAPHDSLGGILYEATAGAWGAGFELVPMPGSHQVNGVVFQQDFSNAIQTMYDHAIAPDDPVVSDTGDITAVGFNNEASIIAWVLDNVQNPDIPFFTNRAIESLSQPQGLENYFLHTGGVVEIKGNPTDGWTLVSWDGQDVSQDPGLLTQLFVDFRDLIAKPQAEFWNFLEHDILGSGTITDTDTAAAATDLQNVVEGMVQFPGAVFNDIADAFQ
jgi:broad specificity phosphatase PhoE